MNATKIARLRAWKTIVFCVMLFCIALSNRPATAQAIDTVKLNELFDYLAEHQQAMGSMAIAQEGKVVYQKSIGYRYIGPNGKIAANAATRHRIWSVTKLYTAVMIMQTVEEGKLSLDTTLDTYFPDVANSGTITLRQMLGHRSGIHDFTKPYADSPSPDNEDIVQQIAAFKPDFEPGEKFDYSNSNYLLLGRIVEKITGTPYGTALHDRITSVTGLSHTHYGAGSLDGIDNKSRSYRWEHDQWTEVPEGDFSGPVPGGAGGIVSTPADMVTFIDALFSGRLLTAASLADMTDTDGFYGLGIMKMPNAWSAGFGHGGGYLASFASLAYHPQGHLAIAYCTNGQVEDMHKILDQVVSVLYDSSYVLPFKRTFLTLPREALLAHAGVYQTEKFALTVALEGDELTAQPEGQPKSVLMPLAAHRFLVKDTGIEIEFYPDNTGAIDRLSIAHGNRTMNGKRITP